MIIGTAVSKSNVLIRLTEKQWVHIVENHDDLAGRSSEILEIIAEPDIIVKGARNEFLAAKKTHVKWTIVVYKEIKSTDGFIITAFITSRIQYLMKKEIVWIKQ